MILLAVGCTQVVRFPPNRYPEDTGWDTGFDTAVVPPVPPGPPPTILSAIDAGTISFGCNLANTAVLASFRTDGWAGGARVLLVDRAGVQIEEHPFTLEDSSPSGQWDRYTLGPLTDDATPPAPGGSTAIRCGENDHETSWALWTTTRAGAPADCAIWGPDPLAALQALTALHPEVVPTCRDLGTRP